MDFDWLSDPLLLYALGLTALLFGGIFILIVTIVIKHSRRLRSEKIQSDFISALNLAKARNQEGKDIQSELYRINTLMQFNKKDITYGWTRLLEKTPKSDRNQYISIATHTNILDCISYCMKNGAITEKCIALEAIGLSNFDSYANEIKKYIEQAGIAPYACIALTRLIGKEALPLVLQSYEIGALSTTQALAALAEIPQDQIVNYTQSSKNKVIPMQLYRYLSFP